MINTIKKNLKDFFKFKESFLICEDTKYHKIVNETTSTFSVIRRLYIGKKVWSEQVIYSELPTFQDARKYTEEYIINKKKEKKQGIVILEELK